jgi:2-succinyl-5-enolpyruvyl-6-hydroxy-3-cyclohexene-1-carboxylate synthase
VNPSTAQATVLVDELFRCGLREAVLAPGSRSAPLAFALAAADTAGQVRLHVRIDERSASFLALGLAKASGRPALVVCTSGTAAAQFHAAVIEASESAVPLIVLTADRPPELRDTGASQTIDQVKLYGSAVRWYAEAGVAQAAPGMAAYWRSLAGRAWAQASGAAGGLPGPVHVNVPLRDPLVPASATGDPDWPEPLDGRPGGAPWTRFSAQPSPPEPLELDWAERGLVICGDGAETSDPAGLVELAAAAGWPVLAEPSSAARSGPTALARYQYLLQAPGFLAACRPEVIVSAGRPGLSRGQLALLRGTPGHPPARHVVLTAGPARWSDPARTATDVAGAVTLASPPPAAARDSAWLAAWRRADAAAAAAADGILDGAAPSDPAPGQPAPEEPALSEPWLARELAAALPAGTLLWAASSLPVRDLDRHMPAGPRPDGGPRVLASRGASGIDGLVSSATGAALAHQRAGGGPAVALLGDLAFLHDSPGLQLGPDEPRPTLCLVVVNNDGGGIFAELEQAAFPDQFERLFGTPHHARLAALAEAANLPYLRLQQPADLDWVLDGPPGVRVAELNVSRAAGAALRARVTAAARAAVTATVPG